MGYQGYDFCNDIKVKFKKKLEIVKRPRKYVRVPNDITDVEAYLSSLGQPPLERFKVQPKRWIVERTFAWIGKYRRLSKDYEYKISYSENLIYLAMIRNMLRKITK
jgi:putative transposase|tara:strand:- start:41 stop:358 length:318 start_codon:yes stop_codon:yes gene_type:complete